MKMKNFFMLSVIALFSMPLMLTSCGEDDDNNVDEELSEENHWGLSDEEWQAWLQQEAELADSMNIAFVIEQLCDIEEDISGNKTYKPKVGEILSLASPCVYSVADSTAENAEKMFWNLLPSYLADSLRTNFPNQLAYNTKYGNLSYERGDGVNTLGIINIDIPELPNMESIEIVPSDLWPNNDASSPFTLGSVWQKGDYKFVCVRERCGGVLGIMVTYDGGWSGLDYWKGRNGVKKKTYKSWIYDNISNQAAAVALDDFVRNKPKKAKSAFSAMERILTNGDKRYYATSRSGKKFHWGPSDYHYVLTRYWAMIGIGSFGSESWKTCEKENIFNMENETSHLMYSEEFDYMDSNTRDAQWVRIAK